MRGRQFLPQIQNMQENKITINNIYTGFYFIIMGLIKKIVFSDIIAIYANDLFGQVVHLNSISAWIAAYLFAFQIYFDFSAYSEIAVGIGHLFGFQLDINFKTPYLSKNPSEFWRRWHITLSSWIRDYIYIPLGGNKKGFFLKCVFLLIAMALSGLWHGAAWTFVIWGIYHGIMSIVHNVYKRYFGKLRNSFNKSKVYQVLCIFIWFQAVNIGWILFRADTFSDAKYLIKKMVLLNDIVFDGSYIKYLIMIITLFIFHIIEYFMRKHEDQLIVIWQKKVPQLAQGLAFAVIIILLILFVQPEQNAFIYFQF